MNINAVNNQNFKGLEITKSARTIGGNYINASHLLNLSQSCNIKISGSQNCTRNSSQACLKVRVSPLKRILNPFVRLFNLDVATGKFETDFNNIRYVSASLPGLIKNLAKKANIQL